MNQYQLTKTIIGGDWNIPFNTIYKSIKNTKFHPIKNTQKSRVRDIDYFITNTEMEQTSVTTQSEISDHNMITNKLSIEKNQEIKKIYQVEKPLEYQLKFIKTMEKNKFELNRESFNQVRKEFRQKKRIIYKINENEIESAQLLKELILDTETINKIRKIKKENYYKLVNQINKEFDMKTKTVENNIESLKFWSSIKKIKKNDLKVIVDNKVMEKEYLEIVKKNLKKPSKETINFIQNFEIQDIQNKEYKNSKNIIKSKDIEELIKYMKTKKSVFDFDKIKNYKTPEQEGKKEKIILQSVSLLRHKLSTKFKAQKKISN
ncbi:hypothetical protein M0813_29966 [Anaeramoeba flamelloides]|uniref:Uncharacterized protein n=1 Tax=Anaeramoeba flamelloides TaxID=1746091 RepID=A0ABQ8XPJ4_9EUKA|nr:hypothetical protein M0813_29966 [Anaeramoeba flamelloides]